MANEDTLIRRRSSMKAKITNFSNYLSVLMSCETISDLQRFELEGRLSKFDILYDEFDNLQSEIEIISDKPEEAYVERTKFEERYHALAAQARALLAKAVTRDDGSVASSAGKHTGASFQNNFIRLPKIDLPHFNGSYQCWLEYRDTFLSLIHSSGCIDDISKFHYLRASLKGSAQEIIKNIDFKGDNYHMAWKLLCDRYDNNRLLVNNHVQALFNVEPVLKESSASLRHLIDVINKNIRALKTLNEPTEYWDTLIVYKMSHKLDCVTGRNWEEYRNTLSKSPTLSQFCNFVNNKADLLESIENNKKINTIKLNKLETKPRSFIVATNSDNLNQNQKTYTNPKTKCPLCSKDHVLYNCESFRNLSVEKRIAKTKDLKVCFNCLRVGHLTKRCRLARCKYCKGRHNTLLHAEESSNIEFQDPMPSSSSSLALPIKTASTSLPTYTPNNVVLSNNTPIQTNTSFCVLLSTALVNVVSDSGEKLEARVLLDNGSTANFVTQDFFSRLGLPRRSTSSLITGINNQTSSSTQSCSLTFESRNGHYKANIDCFILPKITSTLPTSLIDINKIYIPKDIQLADPSFYIPSAIDILVGAEVFWSILGNASINLGTNKPKVCETKLGWIVSGSLALPSHPSPTKWSSHYCNVSLNELNSNLNKFWELDSVSSKNSLSKEEQLCEESFRVNTIRDKSGRFEVTMPLKDNPSVLGRSYEMAKRRFLSLERRFQRDPVFKERYVAFMQEYERLGHMTENDAPCKPHSGTNIEYFLPHHGVLRESSSTTKLRAVFDASAATTSGISLNNIQMVGPTVQNDLLSILLRFRQHKYVICGDIEKMYRAINIHPSQRSLQQIIFRENPKLSLKTYSLNTLTYGTASAPYLATKCLVSLAKTAVRKEVQNSIECDFYVDDYLSGSDSISGVVELGKEVMSILKSAHFNLRKWLSNSQEVLEQITDNSESSNSLNLAENKNVSSKTLGLLWFCNSDSLSFCIGIDSKRIITKRHILSTISQIFDPLGLVGPCVVEAKMIMQKLWMTKIDWDDQVSDDIQNSWRSFENTLPCLNSLNVSRWVLCNDSVNTEIHIFTDASEKAYGACVYVRSTDKNGSIRVQLLVSKNRVAPIKPTTIPRLELCGALLGSRLCTKVLSSLTLPVNSCKFWCDSTIVLNWLSMPPNLLKPFVRNRIYEIQEATAGHAWGYVPSKDNPADLVSRGLKADQISECTLWWSGPTFLLKDKNEWPKMPNRVEKQDLPEVVSSHSANHSSSVIHLSPIIHKSDSQHIKEPFISCRNHSSIIKSLIHKYSKFNYLQRIVAYILRFIYNLRTKNNKQQKGCLSIDELNNSFKIIIVNSQIEMFPEEYNLLKLGKSLPRKNRLTSLSPFIDSDSIIRVGGRLDNSPYDYNVKHPILLCSKHHITKIIFYKYHLDLLHAGPQLLLANIRQLYWPLGGRNLSKRVVRECIKCFKYKCRNVQPTMGQLPFSRTHLEFPFFHCSVDYAGPVLLADRKGRGCKLIKSYLCIFVCLAVKAVHLELVTDLTKEAYMAALNRFIARRGKPQSILSDNATNFVGTSNELKLFLEQSNISSEVMQQGIEFTFAPPYSPHFNGIAEAAVKSTKYHLKRLLQLTHFTFEEMVTCLCQIEAVLNSRPLTPLSSDPLNFTALTPSHFLIGRPLMSIPHPQVADINISRLERFQRMEYIKQHFWKRFYLEYVSLLQQKTKWSTSTGQLSEGALVLVKEKGQPPLLWPLGRVTKVFPGSDGASRVAELKTKRGTIVRGFNNICPLPLS